MEILRINNKLQKFGIEVVSSECSEFDSIVSDYFGQDAELLAFIEAAKPFPLFLKNLSSAHISAISVNWILNARNGERKYIPQGETNFGFIHTRNPVSPERIKSYSVIPSQSLKFYSYIQIPPDLWKRSKAFENSNGGASVYFGMTDQKKILSKNFKDFGFSVESVLFSDGKFVGDDRSFLYESITGYLKAERDFARKIKKLRDNGMGYDEIISKAQADPDRKERHSFMQPPRSAKEAFDNSYAQTILSMRETVFRQKAHTQLSDEQIVNMAIKGLEKADFKIYKADV